MKKDGTGNSVPLGNWMLRVASVVEAEPEAPPEVAGGVSGEVAEVGLAVRVPRIADAGADMGEFAETVGDVCVKTEVSVVVAPLDEPWGALVTVGAVRLDVTGEALECERCARVHGQHEGACDVEFVGELFEVYVVVEKCGEACAEAAVTEDGAVEVGVKPEHEFVAAVVVGAIRDAVLKSARGAGNWGNWTTPPVVRDGVFVGEGVVNPAEVEGERLVFQFGAEREVELVGGLGDGLHGECAAVNGEAESTHREWHGIFGADVGLEIKIRVFLAAVNVFGLGGDLGVDGKSAEDGLGGCLRVSEGGCTAEHGECGCCDECFFHEGSPCIQWVLFA